MLRYELVKLLATYVYEYVRVMDHISIIEFLFHTQRFNCAKSHREAEELSLEKRMIEHSCMYVPCNIKNQMYIVFSEKKCDVVLTYNSVLMALLFRACNAYSQTDTCRVYIVSDLRLLPR